MATTASGLCVHDATTREEGRVSGDPPTNERITSSCSRGGAPINECPSNKPTSADSVGFEVRNVFQQRPDMKRVKQNGNLCRVRKNSVFREDPISWNKMTSVPSFGRRLLDEVENLAERVFDRQFCDELKSSLTRAGVGSSSTCALDTIEKPDSYLIRADAPGVEKSRIQIDVKGNHLTIKGDRGEEKREQSGSFTRFETQRRFSRTVMLPEDANLSKIEASLTRGVLSVNVPKKEQVQRDAKRVEIKDD